MMFAPAIHHRQSIRLRTHDYAAGGVYYVTVCAEERRRLFGTVVNGRMALNDAGRMAAHWLHELENKYPDVRCDALVCMPDHVHFVVRTGCEPDGHGAMRTDAGMDGGTQHRRVVQNHDHQRIHPGRQTTRMAAVPGQIVQRNYYEHVVRNIPAEKPVSLM